MSNPFNLIMVSAWHEQGGNVLHRHLDGHESLYVYPFESQLATTHSSNLLTPAIPQRYCWPEFTTEMTPEQAYQAMWDEELKTYLRTPWRSKFKDCRIEMNEGVRIKSFVDTCASIGYLRINDGAKPGGNTRGDYVEAFFRSTFDAWTNRTTSGRETHYVGYSPPIGMDADKIFADFPNAQIVHIVRNPWSGYADTIKRPFPFSLEKYCRIWSIVQQAAITYSIKYPKRFHVVRYEDLVTDTKGVMDALMTDLGLPLSDAAYYPSFNGKRLESVKPWGTIVTPTFDANWATANELSDADQERIAIETNVTMEQFGYSRMWASYRKMV
jgi:hypothetical protein